MVPTRESSKSRYDFMGHKPLLFAARWQAGIYQKKSPN